MSIRTIAGPGAAGRRLLDHIAGVLDPIAAEHHGKSPQVLRPILASAWREAFRSELREPTLSRCAAAMASGRHWSLALWGHDWP
jgi:hypothetical protein